MSTEALCIDYYQLTMLNTYFERQMGETATFELFIRDLPPNRSFLLAAGLEQALEYLENLRFSESQLEWLKENGGFSAALLNFLEEMRFTGDVDAMPEGTVFFANEPVLRVTAPLAEAQFVETRLVNIIQTQSLFASKAARCVLAAPDKQLVEFGMRRAHGLEAGLFASRAAFIAGMSGTSNVLAGRLYDLPLFGTMARSLVQACGGEPQAFERFAVANPANVVLLLDAHNLEEGVAAVTELAPSLKLRGIAIKGVHIDGNDLAPMAVALRESLDGAGLEDTGIFAGGDLDEFALAELVEKEAPIVGFGVGTRLTTSGDTPYLNCTYQLVQYDGQPTSLRTRGKTSLPGRKQVFRSYSSQGRMHWDLIGLEEDLEEGVPLLHPVMRRGKRLHPTPPLDNMRARAKSHIASLPDFLKDLYPGEPYPVELGESLRQMVLEQTSDEV